MEIQERYKKYRDMKATSTLLNLDPKQFREGIEPGSSRGGIFWIYRSERGIFRGGLFWDICIPQARKYRDWAGIWCRGDSAAYVKYCRKDIA